LDAFDRVTGESERGWFGDGRGRGWVGQRRGLASAGEDTGVWLETGRHTVAEGIYGPALSVGGRGRAGISHNSRGHGSRGCVRWGRGFSGDC
jgi:hypothetical protein